MRLLADLKSDVRHAARLMRLSPVLTLTAVLSLALGIGGNAAIFSVIDGLMLRTLPVREPARLVAIEGSLRYDEFDRFRSATPDTAALSAVVRTDRYNIPITTPDGKAGDSPLVDAGPVRLALTSGNYFQTIGIDTASGRALTADDDRAGATPVVVISDGYWNRRFGRSADTLGRHMTFGTAQAQIVGIAPRGFIGEWIGRPADVWMPIVFQPSVMIEIPVNGLRNVAVTAIGRLAPDVSPAQAQAAWQSVLMDLRRTEAGPNATADLLARIAEERVMVQSARHGLSPQRLVFGTSLWILMTAAGAVLLIACANVANLLLARSESRRREMAVRFALGASRGRLIRQWLTESLLLAGAGAVLGVGFASWAANALLAFVRSGPATNAAALLTMDIDVHLDARLLAFTAGLSIVSAAICGTAAALRGSSVALSPALMGRGVDAARAPRGRFGLGKMLVVGQVALSLVLLGGSLLLVRTLKNLTAEDLGFDRDRVLLAWTLPGQAGGRGAAAANYWQDAISRVAQVPGVRAVSASNQGVLNGSDLTDLGAGTGLRIEGEPQLAKGLPGLRSFIAPGFFKAMGIPIVMGRDFDESDTAQSPRGVVISRAMARHYFGDRNPVGRQIWFPEDKEAPTTIIGVAGDFLIGGPREVTRRPGFTYFSYRDREASRRLRSMMMVIRSDASLAALSAQVRTVLQGPPLGMPVLKIDSVDEQLSDVLLQERLVAVLSGAFGLLSLTLAALGLYGVVSFAVAQRTNEIGIRMALGATRQRVLGATLSESLVLVAAGVVVGVPAMVMLTRLMSSRLFGVSAGDPFMVAATVAILAAVTTVAAFVPAYRASSVQPSTALRQQ